MRIAIIQNKIASEKIRNFEIIEEMIGKAMESKPDMVILPEMFALEYSPESLVLHTETIDGETAGFLSRISKESDLLVVGGSFPCMGNSKPTNTTLIFNKGKLLGRYDKINLFDINIKGQISFKESDLFLPGKELFIFEFKGKRIGLAICFDLRFSDLFQGYSRKDVDMIIVPAAFSKTTGELHWEMLARARAHDTQAYVVLASPARDENASYKVYGHSLVANPWGTVEASLGEEEGILVYDIDFDINEICRNSIPIKNFRR